MKKKTSRQLIVAFAVVVILIAFIPSIAAFVTQSEDAVQATKVETTQQRTSASKQRVSASQRGASSLVEYTIERHDDSLEEYGDVKLRQYYDQVHVLGNSTAANKMNAVFEQAFKKYDSSAKDNLAAVQSPPLDTQADHFQNCYEAKVTKNSEGQFSVKISWDWFMGGVHNNGYEGFNFDARTGEPLLLTDVFHMSEEETAIYIKSCVADYINVHLDYPWWDGAVSTVAQYQLKDFKFYLEDNKVVVVFDEYELGPGALGAVAIPCEMPPILTASSNQSTVNEGEDIQITARITRAEKPVHKGYVALYLCDESDWTEKLLARVDCNGHKNLVFPNVTVSASEGWTIGAQNKLVVRYFNETGYCRAEQVLHITVSGKKATRSMVEQNQPPAPTKLTVTDSSIVLQDIANSDQGVQVQYGIEDAYGCTNWQSSSIFEGLASDQSYTFYAKYPGNDSCHESPISAGTIICTEKAAVEEPQDEP